MFDTQIVVTVRLAADRHSPLRILSGRADREDVSKAVRLFGRGMSMDTSRS